MGVISQRYCLISDPNDMGIKSHMKHNMKGL